MKNDTGMPKDVVSLCNLSSQQMQGFADVVQMHFGLSYKMGVFDKDVSCACFDKDGQPLAVVLFAEIEGIYAGSLMAKQMNDHLMTGG
jgi:hypothetical protein